jgi:signal transduction protein with GAF and PtsI domain
LNARTDTFGTGSLESENDFLRRILEVQHTLSSATSLHQLVHDFVTELSKHMEADRATLFIFDREILELSPLFAQNVESHFVRIDVRMGIVGAAMLRGSVTNVTNAGINPFFNPDKKTASNFIGLVIYG